MRDAIVIGGGISGMVCAVRLAEAGVRVLLASPTPSERSQSVMAAGGINAVFGGCESGDSVQCHIDDTLRGGCFLAGYESVTGLCEHAGDIVGYLERIGTVFSVDEMGNPMRRAFGGQSYKRTCFCGSSTGKQIVSALIMEVRRYEAAGLVRRRLWRRFHSALIQDGICYGAVLFDEQRNRLEIEYADAVVMATGGQNALFGKTTGSVQCDGYAAARLFTQGAELKNLEFIQYHPTTLETSQKRMLVSEASRGEGGRLFTLDDSGNRVYFMEEKYGPHGNLMTRDVVSREVCAAGGDVFLDVSFLGQRRIEQRLPEVRELCLKYRGIDICTEPIPVAPSVHFFMGGLAVRNTHETNIENLFAVGECASIYHGANRLGGNSLLAALYGGMIAADQIIARKPVLSRPGFNGYLADQKRALADMADTKSAFPAAYIRDMVAETMNEKLGIVRTGDALEQGISDLEYYRSIASRISYDSSAGIYASYSLDALLALAHATLTSALSRTESRGAHYRSDYPQEDEALCASTIVSYSDGAFETHLDKERAYES